MKLKIVISLIALLLLGAGGYVFFQTWQSNVQIVAPGTAAADPAKPAQDGREEMNKQRQAGIGSIKDLEQVPLSDAKHSH